MLEERGEREEIIIVRRHDPGHDEGHHGGVWKIAFADFMTAMMAFFLVMWLINAANEQTKKAVASYFTPIKLTDKTSNPKGLNDPKYGQPTSDSEESDSTSTFTSGGKLNQKVPDPVQVNEQALFTDPYAVLSEIAGGLVSGEDNKGEQADDEGVNSGIGTAGGEAFHDPFDPSSWNTELGLNENAVKRDGAGQLVDDGKGDVKAEANVETRDAATPGGAAGQGKQKEVASGGDTQSDLNSDGGSGATKDLAKVDSMDRTASPPVPDAASIKSAETIRDALKDIAAHAGKNGPSIEVVAEGSGVVISIADEFKFGMFDIGSAVPRPETVQAMAEIGKLLSKAPGRVIVSGHTDARKFSGGNYDNWRLSTDRANIARYMLIRGGLDESRIERVEGFAASRLKLPDDPEAAANRRIEIYVRTQ